MDTDSIPPRPNPTRGWCAASARASATLLVITNVIGSAIFLTPGIDGRDAAVRAAAAPRVDRSAA